MEEVADKPADQLRAILEMAKDKDSDKGSLIEQLYSIRYHDSDDAAGMVLRKLSAIRGWAGTVKEYKELCLNAQIREAAQARSHLRVLADEEPAPFRPPADGLPEGWEDPPGWQCLRAGIFHTVIKKEEEVEVRASLRPMWISDRWRDIDSGEHLLQVNWPGGTEQISRGQAMQAKELGALSKEGAPVGSGNASVMAKWLEAAEHQNADIIPVRTSISRVGWTDHDGQKMLQGTDGPHLLRAEDGHKQTAKSLQPHGTWEQWLEAAKVVNNHAVPALLLAASVASALLEPMKASPFVVDLHGDSTKGKTTALRWAASAWGDPSDAGAYILPWNATPAAIEGRAGFLRNLPLLLDDTKKVPVKARENLSNIVYGWGSGQGKARGQVDGVRTLAIWRSVLISTGEAPLSRLAGEHTGLRLRILPISEQPIPNGSEAVGAIEGLDAWGHIGPRLQEWAAQRWDLLEGWWTQARALAEKKINKGPQGQRLAGYLASIAIAIKALQAMGVIINEKEVKELALRSALAALDSADTASEAWERIGAWLVANSDRVSEQVGALKGTKAPSGGWIGRALPDAIAVSPPALEAELRRLGYDHEEILPKWAEKGRLRKAGNSLSEVVWWLGKSTRMYVLLGAIGWAGKDTNHEGGFDSEPDPIPPKKSDWTPRDY